VVHSERFMKNKIHVKFLFYPLFRFMRNEVMGSLLGVAVCFGPATVLGQKLIILENLDNTLDTTLWKQKWCRGLLLLLKVKTGNW
jgi:hypothetical protein